MNDIDLALPAELPEPGFYYHYKHDPAMVREGFPDAGIQNYAYEVLPTVGVYTEDDGPADQFRVEYLPLYPWAHVYQFTKRYGRIFEDNRPLSMFMQDVTTDGYTGPRFRRITDPDTIAKLRDIADEMYGNYPKL